RRHPGTTPHRRALRRPRRRHPRNARRDPLPPPRSQITNRKPQTPMILSRLHPITEAVRSRPRQVEWVLFDSSRRDRRINDLKALCRERGVSVRYGERPALDRVARPNQGAVARMAVRSYREQEDALEGKRGGPLLPLLPRGPDPHNPGT